MTEEQQNPDGQQSAEEQVEETKPAPKDLPSDQEWDHVEFDEKTQRRFNRVYAEMKEQKRLVGQMASDNKKLLDRLENMESSQRESAISQRISDLRTSEKEALESGDYERASAVRDQITDLRVEAKIPKAPPKEEPEVDVNAAQDRWMSENGPRINQWVNERDEKGNLLRPWADPGHEEHDTALAAAKVVMEQNLNTDIETVLQKIDKVNGRVIAQAKRPAAPVLSGGNAPPKKEKTKISEDERKIAAAMGVSPERYAAMQQKLGGEGRYMAEN
jgi:hypothetical protein